MGRYRIDLEYDGTRYSGWQVQRNARTVQGEVVAALERVFDHKPFQFEGAGRTDAGVHALLQTAHLDSLRDVPPPVLRMKINDLLPPDINVLRITRVASTFHARHDAVERSYLYQVSRRRTAFAKRYVWWVKDPLQLPRMVDVASQFVGLHDFSSFSATGQQGDTRVKVNSLQVQECGDLILVRITASHFLWKMVRQIVGVLVEVGRGQLQSRDVEGFLARPSRRPAELTAPPSGLFLERVRYPGDTPMPLMQPAFTVSSL